MLVRRSIKTFVVSKKLSFTVFKQNNCNNQSLTQSIIDDHMI